jgi:hypothetical protein
MKNSALRQRLANQRIEGPGHRRPEDVVAWSGAVQAQEFDPAKWGIGLRMGDGVTDADLARAVDEGRILRTHVLRPTWHFVTPADIRWMLGLTAPRVRLRMATYWRQMELDARAFARGTAVIERALGDGRFLTRAELGEALRRARRPLAGFRLAHLTMYAELEGVICSGPRRGKQSTYALLDERAPKSPALDRDEALGKLARRYLQSHGPATIRDFVWWSGLETPDARRAFDIARAARVEQDRLIYWSVGTPRPTARPRLVHLLPIYDEFLVAYRDRAIVPHAPSVTAAFNRSVNFQHAVIVGGQVTGTWRITRKSRAIAMRATMLRRIDAREQRALAAVAQRYGTFQGMPVELTID